MAAQKLTRGRFVQIIIMLTLLIAAFFWRTITFEQVQKLECELQPQCTFTLQNDDFLAVMSEEGIEINGPSNMWDINNSNNSAIVIKTNNKWLIKTEQLNNLEIRLTSIEGSDVAVVRFKI